MGNNNCKNNPQSYEDHTFPVPDIRFFLEITISPRKMIYPIVIPAQEEMEALIEELSRIWETLHELPPLWGDTLESHRKRKNLSIAELSRRTHVSETTIHKFRRNPHIQPKVTVVMAFVIGLNLHPIYAYDLISKANYNIHNPTLVNFFYHYLINYCHGDTIEVWNRRLEESGLDIVLPGPNFFDPYK